MGRSSWSCWLISFWARRTGWARRCPPGPPPGPGNPGGGQDLYLAGGWGSSLPTHRRRIAYETYWGLRSQATSIRNYMSSQYKGATNTQEFTDMWMIAEVLDARLDEVYR